MPAFVTVAAGLWSDPAVWSPAPPSGGPGLNQADNDTVTISHDVTHDRAGITWLGTGAGGNIAVQINAGGVLRMSRSVSGTLRLWGRLNVAALGILDCGTIASPIPAGVNAAIQFRSTNAAHGLNAANDSETHFVGTPTRTRWTRLIVAVTSGNVIRVEDATGWQVGDPIIFASSAHAFNAPHMTRVTGVTMLAPGDWQVTLAANVNTTYAARKPIGNLGANVHLHAVRPASPHEDDWDLRNTGLAGMFVLIDNETTARANTRVFRSMRWGVGGAGSTAVLDVRNTVPGSLAWSRMTDVAFASWGGTVINFNRQHGRFEFGNCVIAHGSDFTAGAFTWQNNVAGWEMDDCLIPYAGIVNTNASLMRLRVRRTHWGGTFTWQPANSNVWTDALFEDCEFGVPGATFGNLAAGSGPTFVRCVFSLTHAEDPVRGFMEGAVGMGFMPTFNRTAVGTFLYQDCRWPAATNLDAFFGVGGGSALTTCLSPATRVIIANRNADPNVQRIYTPDGSYANDTAVFRSGSPSLRFTPNTNGRAQTLTFEVLAPHNQPTLVAGFLRRDAACIAAGGTITVRLEGAGITLVTHVSAGAAGAWEPFSFNVMQVTGTPATLMLSIVFQSTAGNMWVDDLVVPATEPISTGAFGYWSRGQPIAALLANFTPAADVWAIPLANLTVPASVGDSLRNVEGGHSLPAMMRLLWSSAGTNVTGAPGAPQFRSMDGTKVRFSGTADASGNRTSTIVDAS